MTITNDELIAGIEAKNSFPLDQSQKDAIAFGAGPLLIAAGPGTGKTEVLVARCLKFICCDGVEPGSIMLTTFTEKAAQSLQDRLAEAFLALSGMYPQLAAIDPSALRIGTLHGLCNDILQEYRYTAYQNLRLLDEAESSLIIHKAVHKKVDDLGLFPALYAQFDYLFGNKPQNKLSKWDWAFALQQMFGRVVEDMVDRNALQQAGGAWLALSQASDEYDQALTTAHASDFAKLLEHFRTFLDTGQGTVFLDGDGSGVRLPLTHVLVDEYQDTNPIQESIYLRLCQSAPHNITVVGDDDQALYRFRGGTVECMVGFPPACQSHWGVAPHVVYLTDNHRSNSDIVDWCNDYITSFPQMNQPDVRIAGKPPLNAAHGSGQHPAVSLIRETKIDACANRVAQLAADLKTHGIIEDYSQCVLLLRSAKNSPRNAGHYLTAFENQNIPVYNPRSKDYLQKAEIAQCMGAFIRIVDPQLSNINANLSPSIKKLVLGWVDEYDTIAAAHPDLAQYVTRGAQEIASKGVDQRITPATPTILYRILSHEPFVGYQGSPDTDLRLSKLTRLFESFCSQYGRPLYTDDTNAGCVRVPWLGGFYYGFCGYLEKKGIDDDDEDEVVCPAGFFPVMTIHQSKGLEFDFVFVATLGQTVSSSNAHHLEEDLRPFRVSPPGVVHSIDDSQWHDDIRQHYVAYSRAKHALILSVTTGQLRKKGHETASFGGQGGTWVKQNVPRL
ncbi:UvrD-helicase domain-containing protein [Rhodopirellula baltica]